MAYYDGSTQDKRSQQERIGTEEAPLGSTQYNGTSGRMDLREGINPDEIRSQLQAGAKERGVAYDESDLEGIIRNTGYDRGRSLSEMMANAYENYDQRASNDPGGGGAESEDTGVQRTLNRVSRAYGNGYVPGGGLDTYGKGLFERLTADPSLRDSTMLPAVMAGRTADKRALDTQRATIAEQMGSIGLGNSGAENGAIRSAMQTVGEAQAGREGQMLMDETNNRRRALLTALGLDQNRYNFDNNLDLQYEQLANNRYQFDNNLGFNFAQLQNQANQYALAVQLGLV